MSFDQFDQLTSISNAALKIRALAQIIANYNETDPPIDITIWPQIGAILDELAANIDTICKEIDDHQFSQIKTKNNKKPNRRISHV